MSPEGELELRIAWDGHAVAAVDVASSRPDVGARVLSGRPAEEVAALVPRLFAICSASQGASARLALGAAGARPAANWTDDTAATLRDEAIREYAFRALLDCPRSMGEPPDQDTLRELQAAGAATDTMRERIAQRVFGQPAASWQAMTTFAAFDRWLERGDTAAARLLGTLRFGDGGFGQSDIALLPAPDGQQAARIAAGMEADPDFCRHPRWNDAPAETGALARRHADPIVAELRTRFGHSALTRFAARLRELGALLAGTATLRAGSVPLGGGRGLGWVENARGLLVHLTVVADGRVVRHRILAPTEWNFHPQGALAAGLRGTRYASEADLRHRAALLVQSLDPCVACRIELAHA